MKPKTENKNRLTLITDLGMVPTGNSGKKYRVGLYQCSCGKTKKVCMNSVRTGKTRSCGCYQKSRVTTHGHYKHPLRATYRAMMARCYNKKSKSYKNYGGRGITVCKRWADSFLDFCSDMGEKPSMDHSVDRIDNDGNYSPENCKWSTRKEQARNKNTHNGKYLKGTSYHKTAKRFISRIIIEGYGYHIGYFHTEKDAHKMFCCVYKEWYGTDPWCSCDACNKDW